MRLLVFLTLVFVASFALAHGKKSALIVKNHAYSPLNKWDNGYSESRYLTVLQKLKDVYGPIIEKEGGSFHILQDWSDGAVNMWAWRMGNEFWLEIPGGMARYYLINEEAFLLSACHELGHLLGGAPFKRQISSEGQSDYYATLHCAGVLYPEIAPFKELAEDSEVDKVCTGHKNLRLCQRALKGAKSLSSYYAEIAKDPFPQITTPDTSQVGKSLSQHPPAQCRLDTFVAGFFKKDRPRCWYHPNR